MILLFKNFNLLAQYLKELKVNNKILKYSLSINQRNEIDLVLVAEDQFDEKKQIYFYKIFNLIFSN